MRIRGLQCVNVQYFVLRPSNISLIYLWIGLHLRKPLKEKIQFYAFYTRCFILRDLVPLLQFKKHEKQPWRSVTFSKFAGF